MRNISRWRLPSNISGTGPFTATQVHRPATIVATPAVAAVGLM